MLSSPGRGRNSPALVVRWFIFSLLMLMLSAPPAFPQQSASIRGEVAGAVTDAAGRPLEGVLVRLPELELAALTGADGRFAFRHLPLRSLLLSFEALGHASRVVEVAVQRGSVTFLEVSLSTSPVALPGLVITGVAGVRDALTSPQDVDAVGAEELKALRSSSLGDLLSRTVAGVSNIQTGSQAGIPVIRGLSGTRVRVLQNGVGQEFYQYGVRHHPTTSLVEAERVEVVRGVSSLLYGSDALGGAVNILTKALPLAPEGETLMGGEVEGHFFSNNREGAGRMSLHGGTARFGFRSGAEIRKGGDISSPAASDFFQTSAAGNAKTGRYGDPKYTGTLPHTDFNQWSVYAQGGIRGQRGTGEIFLTHWDNENNFLLPPGGPKGSATNPPVGLGLHLAQTNLSLKGRLILDHFLVKPTLSYQKAVRQAAAPGTLVQEDPEFPVDLAKDVFTGRVELAHAPFRGVEGVLGAEVVFQDGKALGPVKLEPGSKVTNVGVFAFEEVRRGDLTLSGGLRLDLRSMEAEPNSLTGDPGLLDQEYQVASGSFGVAYALRGGVTLAGHAGTGFRAPTVFELFANGEHGGVAAFQRGDPTLGPERSRNLDLSLRWARDRFQGEVTGYWNRIADYIYLENTGTQSGNMPIYEAAQTNAELRGLDALAEAAPLVWLSLGGRFSWVQGDGDALDDQAGASGSGPLPLLPPTQLGAFLKLRGPEAWILRSPQIRVSADRAWKKDAAGVIEPFSQFDRIPFGTASTPGYTLLGLEAQTHLDLGTGPVMVSFTVDNILNEVYRSFLDTYKGYALSPGRNVGVRVSAPLRFGR
jgi:hemoglobin/transferrin/lactoferrin receptor protein